MELRAYLAALRKHWLQIVVATLLGALAGFAAFWATPPTFTSTTDFYVSTPLAEGTNAQSAGQFAEARVNSYVILLSSEQLAKRVIDRTQLSLTPTDVAGKIKGSANVDTVVVTATVTDSDPNRTYQISRAVSETFGTMVDELDNQGRKQSTVVINVVSGPTPVTGPSAPNRNLYLAAGVLLGLVAGIAIAVLRDFLDNTVRTPEAAQALLNSPVIGTVDYDARARKAPLIIGDLVSSRRAEHFRQLRTNIQFVDAAQSAQVLLITSALPEEGKSTTAVNLALTFVQFGERVLLIEGDLRRPRVAQYLGLEGGVGLTDALVRQSSVEDFIQPWGEDGLAFLASGSTPPNPSELLGSAPMKDLLVSLRGRFDRIVIDAPPLLPVTDAVVASTLADGVVFIIRHGKTTRRQVAAAALALRPVQARILGSVLNMRKVNHREAVAYGTDVAYYSDPEPDWQQPRRSQMGPAESSQATTAA